MVALGGLVFADREELAELGKGDSPVEDGVLRRLDKWSKAQLKLTPIVLFGDSLTVCATPPDKATDYLSRWINVTMNAAGQPISLFDLSHPGLHPIHFYAVLDDLLARPVGLLVIEVNLRAFTDPGIRPGAERLPQLSRKLALRDLLRVRGDLELDGLSLFDPLLARLKESLGLLYVFEGVRQVAFDWLAEMGHAANRTLGLRERSIASFTEITHRLSRTYVLDYASHPTANTLRAIAEDLRAANVPFFFYVAPIDVDRHVAQDQDVRGAMTDRLEELRRAVGASQAEWLDLHDALRSSSFRDPQNHLTLAGCPVVARLLVQRVQQRLWQERAARAWRNANEH